MNHIDLSSYRLAGTAISLCQHHGSVSIMANFYLLDHLMPMLAKPEPNFRPSSLGSIKSAHHCRPQECEIEWKM
jgi:hypothetical protein